MSEPWSADKLGAVLAGALTENLQSTCTHTLVSTGSGTAEVFETEDPEGDDDRLVLRRESDGQRFEVDVFVTATPLPAVSLKR